MIGFDSVVFGCGRVRILCLLAVEGDLPVYQITKKTGMNVNNVYKQIHFLRSEGLLCTRVYGCSRLVGYNLEEKNAVLLRDFFVNWNFLENN